MKAQKVIQELDGKRVFELSNNLRNLINHLFINVKEKELVRCYEICDQYKTDFIIVINGQKRNVSMKTGGITIVHNETASTFIGFLRDNHISDETIETILLFQYGDGTINGSGKNRRYYYEIKHDLDERIRAANMELNFNRDFIKKVVERCVFQGSQEDYIAADSMYYGDYQNGYVATKEQFMKFVAKKTFDYYDNLHIGPLLLRPDSRYVGRTVVSAKKRDRIVVYWIGLEKHVQMMSTE